MVLLAVLAAALALPSGWMAVPAPDQAASQCAQYASRSWAVAVQSGRLTVSHSPSYVRDALPFTPPLPPAALSGAGDAGDRHVLRVPDGWLVGYDDGPQQGSLWWFGPRGSPADELFGYDSSAWNTASQAAQAPTSAIVGGGEVPVYPPIGNVRAIVRVRDGIIALTGSSNPSTPASGQGGALAVTRSGGRWHVVPIAILDGAPRAYATDAAGSLLVLTDNGVDRLSVKKSMTQLTSFDHFSLSVHSLAAGPAGSIYIGLQQYVVRLDPAPDEYSVHWFAPNDCPLFVSANGRGCRCVAANGTQPYEQRALAAQTEPTRIVKGSDGALWFIEAAVHRIGRITTAGAISEFPADIDATSDLVAAPDGAIWFSSSASAIELLSADGKRIPVSFTSVAGWLPTVDRLATGADGGLWFVADGATKIVHVTSSGTLVAAVVPEPQFDQVSLAATPDGAMWFTVASADQVGVLTAAGDVRLYAVPALGSGPADPVLGPGGDIWFLETISGNLGTILPDGRVTETPISSASGFASAIVAGAAYGFVLGPDANFWMTEPDEDAILKITPAGAATIYASPRGGHPTGIAAGPDGALWFTEPGTGKIGRITTAGAITEYALPPVEIIRYL